MLLRKDVDEADWYVRAIPGMYSGMVFDVVKTQNAIQNLCADTLMDFKRQEDRDKPLPKHTLIEISWEIAAMLPRQSSSTPGMIFNNATSKKYGCTNSLSNIGRFKSSVRNCKILPTTRCIIWSPVIPNPSLPCLKQLKTLFQDQCYNNETRSDQLQGSNALPAFTIITPSFQKPSCTESSVVLVLTQQNSITAKHIRPEFLFKI